MNNQISIIILELKEIAELLYQENIQNAYVKLTHVIPSLDVVLNDIDDENIRVSLVEKLSNALDAMENEDYTFLADTIQYELIDVLSEL